MGSAQRGRSLGSPKVEIWHTISLQHPRECSSLSASLRRARRLPNGRATWEEVDYCQPPLAEERAAVLDHYFEELTVEPVVEGTGWELIEPLPAMFPNLAER